jgi:hypothetical protein
LISEKLFSPFDGAIWNAAVLMPALCITIAELTKAVEALRASITEIWRYCNASTKKNAEEITA